MLVFFSSALINAHALALNVKKVHRISSYLIVGDGFAVRQIKGSEIIVVGVYPIQCFRSRLR
jgi:hypothetical protein